MSDCGQVKLFGGYKKFGAKAKAQKSFQLPLHKRIRIKFNLFKIDSWDGEAFQLWVDGKKAFERNFGFNTPG